MTSSTLEAKAAALEGLDFIETEEDVKAVEAATLKIQSTFRGKKFRSKASGGGGSKAEASKVAQDDKANEDEQLRAAKSEQDKANEEKLSSKVAQMQVQDKTTSQMEASKQNERADSQGGAAEEDEAQRAATKIQAGFKGYKTRKELEGKLSTTGGATSATTAASSQPDGQ